MPQFLEILESRQLCSAVTQPVTAPPVTPPPAHGVQHRLLVFAARLAVRLDRDQVHSDQRTLRAVLAADGKIASVKLKADQLIVKADIRKLHADKGNPTRTPDDLAQLLKDQGTLNKDVMTLGATAKTDAAGPETQLQTDLDQLKADLKKVAALAQS